MQVFVVIAALIVAISAGLHEDYEEWISFKVKFSRKYGPAEDKSRFQIFQKKLREIEQHNEKYAKGEIGWKQGVTQFTDWTEEEFEAILDKQLATEPVLEDSLGVYKADPNELLEASVDWREKGAVLPVRHQSKPRDCGSCWAFSAVGALEGQVAIHKKQKIPLSPQNLVDCTRNYGNRGCRGGWPVRSFQYIQKEGISSEADYPYVAKDETCKKNARKSITRISGYKKVNPTEKDLISAISKIGPISVLVGASPWTNYVGGVYDNTNCGQINHAVLAVGYTDEYIIVKNSWGTEWGEGGYIRIARGKNICSINNQNSYPLL
ncbi:cathepsin L-like proteinase [Diabrotica virgifera virgifera]|uniref:Cathepsin L1-like n=1 Tax=Diabrotica virgifera virgifera TaxID=50390 RepID=A0ABM5K6F5_DIAVI|nr:cathepsin L-like proteinase [Diabrotica virgifera virgifera]